VVLPPRQKLPCPACLGATLSVSRTELKVSLDEDTVLMGYEAECSQCGLAVHRRHEDGKVAFDDVFASFIERDLAVRAYATSAFHHQSKITR
jgi:hypothetical protein